MNEDIEARLRQWFADNLDALERESGHRLAPEARTVALEQVLLYWRKLRDVAEKVTDTEVKLNLPGQKTAKRRTFGIEGVVDIVREHGRTVMYDLKTHNAELVRSDATNYAKQLNVYAYIWQHLRRQTLDETAIICTTLPDGLRHALRSGDAARIQKEMQSWQPIVQLPFDTQHVQAMIADFAAVVDAIEDHQFEPPDDAKLKTRPPGAFTIFAVSVCGNCDARFSCNTYRHYALTGRSAQARQFQQYYAPFYEDLGEDAEREDWTLAALETMPAMVDMDTLT